LRDLQNLRLHPENVPLCFSIQERLINYIRRIEYRVRNIKSQISLVRGRIRHGRLPHEEADKLKATAHNKHSQKSAYDQLLSLLRDIGNGLAFIYINKWDIKPLCMSKEHAGFISCKKGLRMELALFRHCKAQNVLCILNDITNSLRHGDITMFKHGVPSIMEVKSGRAGTNDARTCRQLERARTISKYLKEDLGQNIYPGQGTATLHRRELTIDESEHRDTVTELLTKALESNSNLTLTLENGLYCNVSMAIDPTHESLNEIPQGGKMCVLFINTEKYVHQAYYPFTLSLSNPEALFAFYDGRCLITVFVDLGVIEQELGKQGIEVAVNIDGDDDFLSLTRRDVQLRINVSRHFFGRLGAEFLSLQWLIHELAALVKQQEKDIVFNTRMKS
jgi:hypothetical protein